MAVLKHTHVARDLVPDFSAKTASGYFLFRHGEYSNINDIPVKCFPLRPATDPTTLAYCLRQITSAIPPRIAIDASTNLSVIDSPRKTIPPNAAITGTLNCTVAALVFFNAGRAAYQIA